MASARPGVLGQTGTAVPVLPPRFALVELALFAVIILAEWLWDPFPDLTRLNPHPYWLPVLLVSLQYGTVSGLLAALLSIVGSVLIGLPEVDIGESYFNYLIRVWTQPVLWLVVALVLGSFRMRQIELRDDLAREVSELRERSLLLVDHTNHLRTRCDDLERQLASASGSNIGAFLDALEGLRSGQRSSVSDNIDRAIASVFSEAQASIYTASGNGLRLFHRHNWPDQANWKTDFDAVAPLTGALARDRRALSVLRSDDEPLLDGQGLAAAPIISRQSGNVIGAIKIEMMPPQHLTAQTTQQIALLASLLADTIERLEHGSLPAANTYEAETRSAPQLRHLLWRKSAQHSQAPSDASATLSEQAASSDAIQRSVGRR